MNMPLINLVFMKGNLVRLISLGVFIGVFCACAQAQPRFEPLTFDANRPKLSLLGNTGSNYVIESSVNLKNWTYLFSGPATNGRVGFVPSVSSNSVHQFYRAYAGYPPD